MVRQDERRRQTRAALLVAAAQTFAELGVESAPVEVIAKRAGRTAGALYDHFDSKEGLLLALVDEWTADNASQTVAQLDDAGSLDEALLALWQATSASTAGDGMWLAVEIELWVHAQRHANLRPRVNERFQRLWAEMNELAQMYPQLAALPGRAPLVMGVLTGLEMMRRADPAAVTDDAAVHILRGVLQTPIAGDGNSVTPTESEPR